MGDRGYVRVHSAGDESVYLYSHWGRSELLDTVRSALARGIDRWGDDSYLARIIFSEMIKDDVMSTTGYGISSYEPDGDEVCSIDSFEKTITTKHKTESLKSFTDKG